MMVTIDASGAAASRCKLGRIVTVVPGGTNEVSSIFTLARLTDVEGIAVVDGRDGHGHGRGVGRTRRLDILVIACRDDAPLAFIEHGHAIVDAVPELTAARWSTQSIRPDRGLGGVSHHRTLDECRVHVETPALPVLELLDEDGVRDFQAFLGHHRRRSRSDPWSAGRSSFSGH